MQMSSTVIYYFSGAGNSLRIARDLAARLGVSSLIRVSEAMDSDQFPAGERVGVVFPVIMMGIPNIISRFLSRVTAGRNTYLFAVAANGGMMAGSLHQVAGILSSRGLALSAGFSVIPHALAADQTAWEQRLSEISETIRKKALVPVPQASFKDRYILTGIGNRMAKLGMPFSDRGFRANEACDGCDVCAQICPVRNVTLAGGRPVWHHHCEMCLACLHWCPQQAILFGKDTAKWLHKCPGMGLDEFDTSRLIHLHSTRTQHSVPR